MRVDKIDYPNLSDKSVKRQGAVTAKHLNNYTA